MPTCELLWETTVDNLITVLQDPTDIYVLTAQEVIKYAKHDGAIGRGNSICD